MIDKVVRASIWSFIGIAVILQLIFGILKGVGIIAWDLVYVFMPFIVLGGLVGVFIVFACISICSVVFFLNGNISDDE